MSDSLQLILTRFLVKRHGVFTYLFILFLASQLWELNDEVLQNKEGHWVSDQDWNFKPGKDGLIYIENIEEDKVLGFSKLDNKVVLEEFEEDKAEQLWKKGEPDDEGYFTLENSKVPKILTAFSTTILKVKGKAEKICF